MRVRLQEVARARSGRSLWQWFHASRQAELVVDLRRGLAAARPWCSRWPRCRSRSRPAIPAWDRSRTRHRRCWWWWRCSWRSRSRRAAGQGRAWTAPARAVPCRFLRAPEIADVISVISAAGRQGDAVGAGADARGTRRGRAAAADHHGRALEAAFPEVRWSFFEPEAPRDGEPSRHSVAGPQPYHPRIAAALAFNPHRAALPAPSPQATSRARRIEQQHPLPFMRGGRSSAHQQFGQQRGFRRQRRRLAQHRLQVAPLLDRVPQRERRLRPARQSVAQRGEAASNSRSCASYGGPPAPAARVAFAIDPGRQRALSAA